MASFPGRNGSLYVAAQFYPAGSARGTPLLGARGFLLNAGARRDIVQCDCPGAFTPDGRQLYLAMEPARKRAARPRLLDLRSGRFRPLPTLRMPFPGGLAFSPDGTRLVYACSGPSATWVCTTAWVIGSTLHLGGNWVAKPP